jgi:hypothetical protein
MKRLILFFGILAMVALAAFPAPRDVRIKQIIQYCHDMVRETVRISGKVIKYDEAKAETSGAYWLKDNFGDQIKILTDKENYPEFEKSYQVTGMVSIDNSDKNNPEVIIYETSRQILGESRPGNPHTGGQDSPGKKNENMVNVFYAIAGVLLVIIAILAVFMISNRYKQSLTPLTPPGSADSSPLSGLPGSTPEGYPEPSAYMEDTAIRMAAPPKGTLKMLTGHLEIVDGYDKLKKIFFYRHPSREETEFILGSEAGIPYVNIQLKAPGVSRKQAKILRTIKDYMLINYSTTNPTKVNDNTLAKDESVILKENDTIQMGPVTLKFHEK